MRLSEIIAVGWLVLAAPAHAGSALSLEQLKSAKPSDSESEKPDVSPIRAGLLRDAGRSYGARGGLAARSGEINRLLARDEAKYSVIFDFRRLLMPVRGGNDAFVMPPIIERGDDAVAVNEDRGPGEEVRVSDTVFRIRQAAQIVLAPPVWQTYLLMPEQKVERPTASLLPKDSGERAVWERAVEEGWAEGIGQADEIFRISLARLERDFAGMLRFQELVAQKMASEPYIATTNRGVTGDRVEMRVGDRTYRITKPGELRPDSSAWKPVVPR